MLVSWSTACFTPGSIFFETSEVIHPFTCVFPERKAKEKEEELKRSTERFREIARRVIQEQLLVVLCANKYSTTR